MDRTLTIAIAGCGSRGLDAYAKIMSEMRDRVRVVAAADQNPERLAAIQALWGLEDSQCYHRVEDILAKPRLADAMAICTPDRCHYEQAKAALLQGYHLLLEKPIAPEAWQCLELAALAEERGLHVMVCHVLRYTAFYQKIKEIIDSSVLGDVATVQGLEHVTYWHQAHSFVRGNWRNASLSSPMILQKCCHDMDILLWLTGKRCKRVSSYGSLKLFRAERAPQGAPSRCTQPCPVADTCPYNAVRYYMGELEKGNADWPVCIVTYQPTKEKLLEALRTGPYGRCVYHCDNDVVDHQVVNLELEDGVTCGYTMTAFTAHGARDLRVMGTMGELVGDMEREYIRVMPFGGEETEIDVTKLTDDLSGHGGGDRVMVAEFVALLRGEETRGNTLSSISRSIESHLVALAAEESRLQNGKSIEMPARN